jgi:hypothetical protein
MTKQVLLYYVHRNISIVLFLYNINFFFQIILDNIIFMKIKILKPKQSKFKFKIKWITFCEIHTKYTFSRRWKSASKRVIVVCFHPTNFFIKFVC